jgi:lactoylglutathione lyase
MISHVKFVSINVRDQQRALAFYRDKHGFEVLPDAPMDPPNPIGARWIEVKAPADQTKLDLFLQEDESKIGDSRVVFSCEDIQATHRKLTAQGVEFVRAPSPEFWASSPRCPLLASWTVSDVKRLVAA